MFIRAMLFRILSVFFLISVLWSAAEATPYGGEWHTETFLGENTEYFFILRASTVNPGSYYSYSETITIERVSKATLEIVETWPVKSTSYIMDQTTQAWNGAEDSVAPVDLTTLLGEYKVRPGFAEELHLELDVRGLGIDAVLDSFRVEVVDKCDVQSQLPNLGRNPHVVTVIRTNLRPRTFTYLAIRSGPEGDTGNSVDILVVSQKALQEARNELSQMRTKPRSKAAAATRLLCESIPESIPSFELLKSATLFTTPQADVGGSLRPEACAFISILRSDNPVTLFYRLLEEGTPPGILYGLLGLYFIDQEVFEGFAKRFAMVKQEVSTASGCDQLEMPFHLVIKAIREGKWVEDYQWFAEGHGLESH